MGRYTFSDAGGELVRVSRDLPRTAGTLDCISPKVHLREGGKVVE